METPNYIIRDETEATSTLQLLEIGDIGSTHFLITNKFCFARPHLMLLTSDGHQRQYEPLHENDLGAAWSVLSTIGRDYIAFYNCGRDGG